MSLAKEFVLKAYPYADIVTDFDSDNHTTYYIYLWPCYNNYFIVCNSKESQEKAWEAVGRTMVKLLEN